MLASLHEAFQGSLPGSELAGGAAAATWLPAAADPAEHHSSPGAFLRRHAAVLTAALVQQAEAQADLQQLAELAMATGCSGPAELVQRHFATVFAFCWPYIATGEHQVGRAFDSPQGAQ